MKMVGLHASGPGGINRIEVLVTLIPPQVLLTLHYPDDQEPEVTAALTVAEARRVAEQLLGGADQVEQQSGAVDSN